MAPPQRTTSETIYQACVDLHNAGRLISRQILAKITVLRMGIVDDHVTRMVEQGRLRRVSSGILEVVEQYPANRKFNKSIMRDGMIEISLGSESLEMTPSEAGMVGQSLQGEATMYSQLRGDRDLSDKVAKLEQQRAEDRRRMTDMAHEIVRLNTMRQPELEF